ncbi:hypothetical protein OS493_030400 [Desmophyllum pertusum]|uniref:Uncharacterized protein n=1 Tax=Desmophyllum pertusum TaxID=174260 RepID=A0A9W9Z9E5_9CNID|nr:hypothetical protein OS493_030400 [Desmophyllum pertusum]
MMFSKCQEEAPSQVSSHVTSTYLSVTPGWRTETLRTEDPRTEDPRMEDPRTEDPSTEDPRTEDPARRNQSCHHTQQSHMLFQRCLTNSLQTTP